MAWFRKRNMGDVVWYRHSNYKGNLSEDQKMELDFIRWKSKSGQHPATKFEDLPEEVQSYIAYLENEISESKLSFSIFSLIVGASIMIYCAISVIGIVHYSEVLPSSMTLSAISIALVIFGVLDYRQVQKDWGLENTDAKLMEYWELNYISRGVN